MMRFRIEIVFLLLVGSFFMVQCSSDAPVNDPNAQLTTQDTVVAPVQLNAADVKWFKQFNGTINGTIAISMQLNRKGTAITGSYYYDRVSKPLRLHGYMHGDSVVVEETSAKGALTGRFVGLLLADREFIGVWQDGQGKKQFPFEVKASKDSAVVVSSITYYKTDCSYRDSLLRYAPSEITSEYDTVCPVFEAVQLVIGGLAPTANKRINAAIVAETLGMADYEAHSTFQSFVNGVVGSSFQQLSIGAYVHFMNSRFISICYTNDFYGGGAHPLHASKIKNYNLSNGEEIALEHIFTTEFLGQLDAIGEKEFIDQNGSEGWDFVPGQFKLPSNFSISQEGVEFVFNQYEIGPYAAGMPSVFIAFNKYSRGVQPQWLRKNI